MKLGWERGLVLGLFLAAILMMGLNLGEVPLRDWDEGIVAQVARQIWRSPPGSLGWLYPTTLNGEPYFSKPPLVHWLIALTYSIAGVNEWTTRLPGATLTALSVPLVYWLGRELFLQPTPALFSALVYLTFLPVVRHGRLAMLDGTVVCFFLFMLACLLRARRDLRWALGVGIGFGLICLTKGILGLLLGAIALLFLAWDTPRLLTCRYLWAGFFCGSAPVFTWYIAQWSRYQQVFLGNHFMTQSFNRLWEPVSQNQGPPWYYLIEILKYAWPWLLVIPQGWRQAWEQRNLGWARLLLLWAGGYLLVISGMKTKLPWYILPLYPALALVAGMQLAQVWQMLSGILKPEGRPPAYLKLWAVGFGLLALGSWAGFLYFRGAFSTVGDASLQPLALALALTMTVTTVLILRQNAQFIAVLIWGSYVSLLLLVASPHWNWELAEAFPVKPVAALIRQNTPPGQVLYTSFSYNRPSLDFYSDRRVLPASGSELQQHWLRDLHPYLLVESTLLPQFEGPGIEDLGSAAGFTLITRGHAARPMASGDY